MSSSNELEDKGGECTTSELLVVDEESLGEFMGVCCFIVETDERVVEEGEEGLFIEVVVEVVGVVDVVMVVDGDWDTCGLVTVVGCRFARRGVGWMK